MSPTNSLPWWWQARTARRTGRGSGCSDETAAFAAYLRGVGVGEGDRVVGYLPNIGEAVVAFLATASVGAIWAVCNPDLAVGGVTARLGQLQPTVLVAADGTVYGGKRHDKRAEIAEIRAGLPTLKATVVVPRLGLEVDDATTWAQATAERAELDDDARTVRPSAVGAVLLGNHRDAEGHRARARRCGARASEIPWPAPGSASERAVLLVHHHQLDDVELPGRRPARRRDDRALRRQPDLPADRRHVAGARTAGGRGVRCGSGLSAGLRQGGAAPR